MSNFKIFAELFILLFQRKICKYSKLLKSFCFYIMDKTLHYYDPNHGGCLRIVNLIGRNKYVIKGAYGSDEGKKGYWIAYAEKKPKFNYKGETYNLVVDFSEKKIKTHGPIYNAYMGNRKIKWQDGNVWELMYS